MRQGLNRVRNNAHSSHEARREKTMDAQNNKRFVIIAIVGDNRPNSCTGPFTSKEAAKSWLEEGGYEPATPFDDGLHYTRKSRGLWGDGHDVWIRELGSP